MTCLSCHYSQHQQGALRGILWCIKYDRPARSRCSVFVYEPGSDEEYTR